MSEISRERVQQISQYRLPTYQEIPSVGLYLDQTSKYINEALETLPGCVITNSMISNYVKHRLIDNPVKKQYYRDQIASLIFITAVKSVMSLEHLSRLLRLQKEKYPVQKAYESYSQLFNSYLHDVFAGRLITEEEDENREKQLLKTIVITAVRQMYLDENVRAVLEGNEH